MPKKLCFLWAVLALPLFASDQLVLVVAEHFNAPSGTLQRYVKSGNAFEKYGAAVPVNLGRNGLGWGVGAEFYHSADEPVKKEGDGRSPAGIFALNSAFGYAGKVHTKLPYMQASEDLICVDDSDSPYYNTLRRVNSDVALKSFEWMKREDDLYRLGVTVAHNGEGIAQRGSCIFLHVQKAAASPTSGCTSMRFDALQEIIGWLDPAGNPLLIQIPKAYCDSAAQRFNGLLCP